MAHPLQHAKSSVLKFGGKEEDYIEIHNWFDETKHGQGTCIIELLDTIPKVFLSVKRNLVCHLSTQIVKQSIQGMSGNNMSRKIVITTYQQPKSGLPI